jgi:hypothetical protein
MAAARVPPSAWMTSQSRDDRALAQCLQVHHRPQGAPDETLDLLSAARRPPAGDLARRAGDGRAGQQRVLRSHPAFARAAQKLRHRFVQGGRAQHARVAHLDQHRALGCQQIARRDAHGTQLVGRSLVCSQHDSGASQDSVQQQEEQSHPDNQEHQTGNGGAQAAGFLLLAIRSSRLVPHHSEPLSGLLQITPATAPFRIAALTASAARWKNSRRASRLSGSS